MLTASALYGELNTRVAYERLQMLVLLRIEMLGLVQFLLGSSERFFNRILIDPFLANRVLGQDMHAILVDFREAATYGEEHGFRSLRYA